MRPAFHAFGPVWPAPPQVGDREDAAGGRRFRAVFISDVHLGTAGCQALALLDFLQCHPSEHLYLAGAIADGWQLRKGSYWPQSHNDIVQTLLRRARQGCRVALLHERLQLPPTQRAACVPSCGRR